MKVFLFCVLAFLAVAAGNKVEYFKKNPYKFACYIRKQKCCYKYRVSNINVKKIIKCHKKFMVEKCPEQCTKKCEKVCKEVPKTELKKVCAMKAVFEKPKNCRRNNRVRDSGDRDDDDENEDGRRGGRRRGDGEDDDDDDENEDGRRGGRRRGDGEDDDDDDENEGWGRGGRGRDGDDEDDDYRGGFGRGGGGNCKSEKVIKKVCSFKKIAKKVRYCKDVCTPRCKKVCKKVPVFANIIKTVKVKTFSPIFECSKPWGPKVAKPKPFTKYVTGRIYSGRKMHIKPMSKICAK